MILVAEERARREQIERERAERERAERERAERRSRSWSTFGKVIVGVVIGSLLIPMFAGKSSERPSSEGFAFGKATLSAESKKKIDEIVTRINVMHLELEVIIAEGHTERIEDEADNQNLSGKRAIAVKDYLISKGIPANRIYAEGMGSKQPITKSDQCVGQKTIKIIECLQPDRRVDIEIIGTGTMKDAKSAQVPGAKPLAR